MKRPAAAEEVAHATAPKKRPETGSKKGKPASEEPEEPAREAEHEFPEPNLWPIPPLPDLGRALHVAMPCIGIDGAGVALQKMKVPFRPTMVYDLESRYHRYLEDHLPPCTLHLGKEEGDVCKLEPHMIERPVDLLISGPPCPPWAGQGNKLGRNDPRAAVFIQIVTMVVLLAKANELIATILENVKGILEVGESGQSFMESLLYILRQEVSEFWWDFQVLKAQNFGLGQQRTRAPLCKGFFRHPFSVRDADKTQQDLAKGFCSKLFPCSGLPPWIAKVLWRTPRNSPATRGPALESFFAPRYRLWTCQA